MVLMNHVGAMNNEGVAADNLQGAIPDLRRFSSMPGFCGATNPPLSFSP